MTDVLGRKQGFKVLMHTKSQEFSNRSTRKKKKKKKRPLVSKE